MEQVRRKEGKLPDTVYYQIDGGSENTARCWFALAELFVARRLCKRLVLTRLRSGHTHEDIDSRFGNLWKKIRNKYVYTPQEYQKYIVSALSTKKHQCKVEDLIAIPDYKSLLDNYIDPAFVACTKTDKTQLQWSFEAVTPSAYFPQGVRVQYRAYAADEVIEVVEDCNQFCGVYAKATDIFWFPMKNSDAGLINLLSFLFVLQYYELAPLTIT